MFAPCVTARRGPMVRDGCAQRVLDGCAEVRMRRSMDGRARRCREVATCGPARYAKPAGHADLPDTPGVMGECRLPPRHAACCGPVAGASCRLPPRHAGCWRAGWGRGGAGSTHAGTPPYVLRQHPRTPLASSARVFPPSAHSPLVIPRPAGTCGASCTRPYAPFRDRSDSTIRKVDSAYHRMGACLHFSLMREGLPRPA